MSNVIIKPVAEGQMHFQTEDGAFTLPFDVICQAADQIREIYQVSVVGYQPLVSDNPNLALKPPGDE